MSALPPLDPAAAVRAAVAHLVRHPARTYVPPGTQADPHPDPVQVPATVEIVPDLSALPAELLGPGGTMDLGSRITLLWALLQSMHIRSVQGAVTITGDPTWPVQSVWPPGATIQRAVQWTHPAPSTPTGVLARAEAGVLAAGRIVAQPVEGTATTAGCTLTATNVSSSAVPVTAAAPVALLAQALYLWTPPIQEAP